MNMDAIAEFLARGGQIKRCPTVALLPLQGGIPACQDAALVVADEFEKRKAWNAGRHNTKQAIKGEKRRAAIIAAYEADPTIPGIMRLADQYSVAYTTMRSYLTAAGYQLPRAPKHATPAGIK